MFEWIEANLRTLDINGEKVCAKLDFYDKHDKNAAAKARPTQLRRFG